MTMRSTGRMPFLRGALSLLAAGQLSAASISATVTMGQSYCHVVSFSRGWRIAPMMKRSGSDHFELGPSKLEFRATEADT